MHHDYVQRFLFEDLEVRGRLVSLGKSWRSMIEGRDYPSEIAELLGHTTALAVLLGSTRKDSNRITLQVHGKGPVTLLVADCRSGLRIRGMANYEAGALEAAMSEDSTERALIGEGRLALTLEDARTGQVYQSLVPLEGETLAGIFSHYLAQSEQQPATLLLYADRDGLAGMLLEKLPGADARDPDGWNRINHLAATLTLAEARALRPHTLLTRVFPEELMRVFALDPVRYHCPYDPENVANMLRGLGREEVESILAEQGEVLIRNEMCNHVYRFGAAEVKALFEKMPQGRA